MTRTHTTNKGVTLKRAGVYTTLTPEQGVAGITSGGTIFLVGESDGGPHWSAEANLEDAWFGPDQRSEVMRKYVNGPLVAAYVGASRPSGDDAVSGAPSKIYLVKTNTSVRATSTLTNIAAGTYHTLADKNYGALGNMIYRTVTSKAAEVVPTTGAFTLLIPNNTTAIDLRVNGGAALTPTITAALLPPAIVTNLNALTGVDATGGTDRTTVSAVAGTLAVAIVSGNDVTFTRSIVWNVTPTVGDSIYIPSGSAIQGAGNENRGSYVVTAVTATTISATKLLDAAGAAGACTAPAAVAATNIAAVTDLKAYAPVLIFAAAADPIDGAGKTLEVSELTSQTGRFTDLCYQLNTTKVTWISTAASPKVINSTSEYAVYLNVYRQFDNVSERIGAGGEVAFALSYAGTTATLTITSTTLTTTVAGGSGASQTLSLGTAKKPAFPTISDLVAKLNSFTGYSCALVTTALGQRSPFMLDEVTALGICSTHGGIARTGRVKVDAAKFFDAVQASPTVQLGATTALNVPAAAGLPALATSTAFLAGGARGATTDAAFQLAVDALERIRGNIVVPLISRDATSDIADGITDAASTYTLAATNAYCKTHVLAMSDTKVRRERQALCSCEGTFAEQRQAGADLSTGRCSVAIQQVLTTQPDGIQQDQPWMLATLAGSMQLAAFTRGGILKRKPNISGAVQLAGDFDPLVNSQVELALDSGLLVVTRDESDELTFESDQTSHTKDDSFYHNSIRAIYIGDVITQYCRRGMEQLGIGESIADFEAETAKAALTGLLDELARVGALARSDDAPAGYRDVSVKLAGNVIACKGKIIFADVVQFIPIDFTLGQAKQSA